MLVLFVTGAAFSQKVLVDVAPSSATFYLNSKPMKKAKKVNTKAMEQIVLGHGEGYATNGYSFAGLKKLNKEAVTIQLDKIEALPAGYNSKRIVFKKITDATGKVDKPAGQVYTGFMYVQTPATNLEESVFSAGINTAISDFGYNLVDESDDFGAGSESSNADLGIKCTIKAFQKDTRGSGFQISLIMEWSVYSYAEKKVVLKMTTAGYSDNSQRKFNSELPFTLADGVKGLLNSKEFKALAKK